MEKEEKYINHLLKLILEKSQETIGYQKLEKLINKSSQKATTQKEKEESLMKILHIIKSQMLDSQLKKYIIHGDMKIFYSLFYIFKSTGLNNEHCLFFDLIEPLFEFFQKKDSKIVICSVNIIIKIIRENKNFILKHFNNIFDKLIILILRKEIEIRNTGYFLDEIMKNDIGVIFQDIYIENNEKIKLNLKSIIDYLIKRLEENKNYPAVNILIVSWFNFFDTIPKLNITNNYIRIIPKLFKMLCSKTKEEIQLSEYCLKKIINNIGNLYEDLINIDSKLIYKILELILKYCDWSEQNEQIKKCSFELLEIFLKKFNKIIEEYNEVGEVLDIIDEKINLSPFSKNNDSSFYNESFEEKNDNDDDNDDDNDNKEEKEIMNDKKINIGSSKMNNIFIEEQTNKDQDKIKILMDNLPFKLFPNILEVIIHNTIMNSNKAPIYESIAKCNLIFIKIMNMIRTDYFNHKIHKKAWDSFEIIIKRYVNESSSKELSSKLIFDWISLLYKRNLFNDEEYLKHLIFIINEMKEYNIKRIFGILNEISLNKNCIKLNNNIIDIIIQKFNEMTNMIKDFGILILKELIKIINIKIVFEDITNYLLKNSDIFFVMRMINLLNKFLITEDDANEIRIILNKYGNEGKNEIFFEKLFTLWSFNPFCTLILVLLSNSFELGYALIEEISQMKLKHEDYIELSQVVQVFESSIFNNVRIKLINPNKCKDLIKTLYSILLLLPQGKAFDALSCRLRCLEIINSLDDDDDDDNKQEIKEDNKEENKENNEENNEENKDESKDENNISSFNELEASNHEIDIFSGGSSNSFSSNFKLSNKSFKNLQKDSNKFPQIENSDEFFTKKKKLSDKMKDGIYQKKGKVKKYIDIFREIQIKKKNFEENINENVQKKQCFSPTYIVKKK